MSSSYDSTVKVWDVRSNYPLFTLKSKKDKILATEWKGIY